MEELDEAAGEDQGGVDANPGENVANIGFM
jgi:hypothetical protein